MEFVWDIVVFLCIVIFGFFCSSFLVCFIFWVVFDMLNFKSVVVFVLFEVILLKI